MFVNRKKVGSLILLMAVMVGFLPKTTYAHDAYFLEATLSDVGTYRYMVAPVLDKPGWSVEANHLEAKLGNFTETRVVGSEGNIFEPTTEARALEFDSGVDDQGNPIGVYKDRKEHAPKEEGFVYMFPSKEEGAFSGKNNATQKDMQRAALIGDTLSGSLNGILGLVNEGMAYQSVNEFIAASIALRGGQSVQISSGKGETFNIYYMSPSSISGKKPDKGANFKSNEAASVGNVQQLASYGKDGLYCYVWKEGAKMGEVAQFVWAMPKGYTGVDGFNKGDPYIVSKKGKVYGFVTDKKDTEWITIHHISHLANYSYTQAGVSTLSAGSQDKSNIFTNMIVDFIGSILTGVRSAFGLYSSEQLIYNQGLRSSGLYEGGLMSTTWWAVVLQYHTLFQIIAWTVIGFAILKLLIQLNFSTINPTLRVSLMESTTRLLTVGFLLVCTLPITQLMASFNNVIVEIFASQAFTDGVGIRSSINHSNILTGLIMEILFFGADIYLNFIYITRSIMLAILIASGPIFIVTMAFSTQGKGLMDNWLRELVANIFLQAFHAFAFAFILQIQGSSIRGVEQLAIAFSMMPLTEFFRGMMFSGAGSATMSIAKTAADGATESVKSAASLGLQSAGMVAEKGSNMVETHRANKSGEATSKESSGGGLTMNTKETANAIKSVSSAADRMKTNSNDSKGTSSDTYNGSVNHTVGKDGSISGSKGSKNIGKKVGTGLLKATASTLKTTGNAMNAISGAATMGLGMATGDSRQTQMGGSQLRDGLSGFTQQGLDAAGSVVDGSINLAKNVQAKGGIGFGKAMIGVGPNNAQKQGIVGKSSIQYSSNTGKGSVNHVMNEKTLKNEGIVMSGGTVRDPGHMIVDTNKMTNNPQAKASVENALELSNLRNKLRDAPERTPEQENQLNVADKTLSAMGYKNVSLMENGKYRVDFNPNYYNRNDIRSISRNAQGTIVESGSQDMPNLVSPLSNEGLNKINDIYKTAQNSNKNDKPAANSQMSYNDRYIDKAIYDTTKTKEKDKTPN